MVKKLLLEIVTPDRKVLSQEVEYIGAPGALGEFGVLPSHIHFLSALGIGNLCYKDSGKAYYVFVAGGFCEVSGDKVTVLAEVAETASEIDIERARLAQERARVRLTQQQEKINFARAQVALRKALTRISCSESANRSGTC